MADSIKIRKGLNIPLKGEADMQLVALPLSERYAVKPTDYTGVTPKLLVKEGDNIRAGAPVFFSKDDERLKFVSPISGVVEKIVRGEKRKILEVVIKTDTELKYKKADISQNSDKSSKEIIDLLLNFGLWPFIIKRPYAVIAKPEDKPKAIFISGFDTSPLAPDYNFILKDRVKQFQKGIDILKRLTDGKLHLNLNDEDRSVSVLSDIKNVELNYFSGPHPAGNVGTQINKLQPINKGEVIWCVNPQDVAIIGDFFLTGEVNLKRIMALTGSQVKVPKYYSLISGAQINDMIKDNVVSGANNRIICGNALTGEAINVDGYTGFYKDQITIIPEGNKYEMLGWALPGFSKFSISKTFFSWLLAKKKYALNTNYNGGNRAYVVTGEYEKVFPFDILPQQLIKAIIIEDIDLMERLGIYEVAEEDFALCEFVCSSKIEVQNLVRKGLDLMRKEME